MKKKRIGLKILIIVIIILGLLQFWQPPKNAGDLSGPQDITHIVAVPDSVMAVLKVACYDCHSNKTRYPWYNNITPVNWWLYDHIVEGKRHFNFTTFTTNNAKRMAKKLDEVAKTVEKGQMPLNSYLWIHTDAKLDSAQKQMLIDWAKSAEAKIKVDSSAAF